MPNPDGTPLWNEPGFQSTVQQYQNLGGDMNRIGEFLFAGGAKGNTIAERTRDFNRARTPEELARERQRDADFNSMFLTSQAYNPGGANSYAISNNLGNNNGLPMGMHYVNGQLTNKNPYLSTLSNGTNTTNNTGRETRTGTETTNTANNTTTTNNTTNNNQNTTNTTTGGLQRGDARRSTLGAFSDGPQYSQFTNNTTPLSGMYNAQNLDQSMVNRGVTANRGIDFSRALWR